MQNACAICYSLLLFIMEIYTSFKIWSAGVPQIIL